MKRLVLLMALIGLSLSVHAGDDPGMLAVEHLAKNQVAVGKDIKLKVTRGKIAICGTVESDGYTVDVLVNKYERYFDTVNLRTDFMDKWEVVKTYKIFATDLNEKDPRLVDQDLCNE